MDALLEILMSLALGCGWTDKEMEGGLFEPRSKPNGDASDAVQLNLSPAGQQAFVDALLFVAASDGTIARSELNALLRRLDDLGIGSPVADLVMSAHQTVVDSQREPQRVFFERALGAIPASTPRDMLVEAAFAIARADRTAWPIQSRAARELAICVGWDEARILRHLSDEPPSTR